MKERQNSEGMRRRIFPAKTATSQGEQNQKKAEALTAKDAYGYAVKKARSLAGYAEFVKVDNFAYSYSEKGVSEIWIVEFVSESQSKLYQVRVFTDKGLPTSLFAKEPIAASRCNKKKLD